MLLSVSGRMRVAAFLTFLICGCTLNAPAQLKDGTSASTEMLADPPSEFLQEAASRLRGAGFQPPQDLRDLGGWAQLPVEAAPCFARSMVDSISPSGYIIDQIGARDFFAPHQGVQFGKGVQDQDQQVLRTIILRDADVVPVRVKKGAAAAICKEFAALRDPGDKQRIEGAVFLLNYVMLLGRDDAAFLKEYSQVADKEMIKKGSLTYCGALKYTLFIECKSDELIDNPFYAVGSSELVAKDFRNYREALVRLGPAARDTIRAYKEVIVKERDDSGIITKNLLGEVAFQLDKTLWEIENPR